MELRVTVSATENYKDNPTNCHGSTRNSERKPSQQKKPPHPRKKSENEAAPIKLSLFFTP